MRRRAQTTLAILVIQSKSACNAVIKGTTSFTWISFGLYFFFKEAKSCTAKLRSDSLLLMTSSNLALESVSTPSTQHRTYAESHP